VPLVQAIQEQQAEIEALKEQNKLLQQQIDALKNE
jgi:cell division protein FtsB